VYQEALRPGGIGVGRAVRLVHRSQRARFLRWQARDDRIHRGLSVVRATALGVRTKERPRFTSTTSANGQEEIAITRFSNEQTAELNSAIKPRLSATYEASASLFSKRGKQIVDRAMKKGTVGGDLGMQLLFEPAMLLSVIASADVMYELSMVAKDIPFIGNYNQWLPASATIAAAYRALSVCGDPRTPEVEACLALPGHGGFGEAMTNRLEGHLVAQIRSDAYAPPLTLPQLSYAIGRLRELSVMWAFGGSDAWPRQRITAEITAVRKQVADYLVPGA